MSTTLRRRSGSEFRSIEQAQEPIENRQGMRRIAGDVKIDRKDALDPVVHLGIPSKDTSRDGGGADDDHDLGRGDRLVGRAAAPDFMFSVDRAP